MRSDNRAPDVLRPISIQRRFTRAAPGSVLVQAGGTVVLCTASIDESVPPWKKSPGNDPLSGWVTAEYSMLPGSTVPRKPRERAKIDGRSSEIQRLIGRSLRAVVDLDALGPRTVTVDCDVLEADGGTRTLSITGGFIALADALLTLRAELPFDRSVLRDSVAAVSVGIVKGEALLDLNYEEDSRAEVDMNVVMTGGGRYVEVQGSAERQTYSREQLWKQLELAEQGIRVLASLQRDILGTDWPLDTLSAT